MALCKLLKLDDGRAISRQHARHATDRMSGCETRRRMPPSQRIEYSVERRSILGHDRTNRQQIYVMVDMFQLDLNQSFPHLTAAPIVEAVIHWQARAELPWDPARWHTELAARFPDYPNFKPQQQFQVEARLENGDVSTQVHRDRLRGVRLTSNDRTKIVQLTRDGVVFSRLRPYEDWARFSAEAIRFWEAFKELAGCTEVQRLGVRYINRVDLRPGETVGTYLKCPPRCLEPLGLMAEEFLYQSTFAVPALPFKITVTQAVQPRGPAAPESSLIVDVDVFTTQPLSLNEDIQANLTRMRWLKDKTFFSLFTDEAVETFGVARP